MVRCDMNMTSGYPNFVDWSRKFLSTMIPIAG